MSEIPLYAGGRRMFARSSLSARLRDSFYFGSPPKQLNRFFKRRRASLVTGGYCPYAGRAVPSGTRNGQPQPSSLSARDWFEGTVLFVNKENQKNFQENFVFHELPAALTNAVASQILL